MVEHQNDEESREDRKNNIIIFNAPESNADSIDQRKSHDKSLFINACNSICESNIPTSEIIQVRRFGKRLEDNSNRPLLVKLKSDTAKRRIFSQLYKLRNSTEFSSMSMSHDMTKEERLRTKMLVEEAKQKKRELSEKDENNESKNWVFRVRGPPWNQRIEKVRLRDQY